MLQILSHIGWEKIKSPTSGKTGQKWGTLDTCLVDAEVKDVGNLEVRPVYQDEVSTDEDVHVIRRWRRKRDFEFMRTRLHPGAKFDGHESLSDNEALLPGGKAITPG